MKAWAVICLVFLSVWSSVISALPVTDTVSVNGREWAQVEHFTELSWNDVNAVCPGGVCGAGTLNGYDLEGWMWASVDEVNGLFNHYLGNAGVSPSSFLSGQSHYLEIGDTSWGNAFVSDFIPTLAGRSQTYVFGLTQDTSSADPGLKVFAGLDRVHVPGIDVADQFFSDGATLPTISTPTVGVWLYRTAEVPSIATLHLLILALALMFPGRRLAIGRTKEAVGTDPVKNGDRPRFLRLVSPEFARLFQGICGRSQILQRFCKPGENSCYLG